MTPSEQKATFTIPDHLVRVFRSALSLPDDELRRINGWAKGNVSSLVSGDFDLETLSEELDVPRTSVYPSAQTITSILFLSDPPGTPNFEILTPGLNELGPNFATKARMLLEGVTLEASEAEYIRQKGYVSQVALPTLENITAVCDLRGVFQVLPSPGMGKTPQKGITTLLGFEPMAIVAIELSDASGNDSTDAFQVNEKGLRNILRALEQCLTQLETLREHQKSFARSSK